LTLLRSTATIPSMLAHAATYDLTELSAAAGVTPRTIRYYVQQGLLPSPGTRGPGTRYDRVFLDRLQLIRRLQRQHLPLAEIRRQLEALDDDGVRAALASSQDQRDTRDSSALDYVRDLLARQSARTVGEPDLTMAAPPAMSALATPPSAARAKHRSGSMLGAVFGRVMPAEPEATQPAQSAQPIRSTRSTWERIPLAPDVELHVRRPLSREQNRQVERLLEAARDLFAEEP
jgi:DNA-binding transcriptional MerR regulator